MNGMERSFFHVDSSRTTSGRDVDEPVLYICGECGVDVSLLAHGAAVRCRTCGCRILYKKRTRKMIQYEAR